MATTVKTTKPRTTAPARRNVGKTVVRKQHQWTTSEIVALWLLRHTARGLKWTATKVGTHTGQATIRAAKHTNATARQWAQDSARFGFGRPVGSCHCGWRGPADMLNQHWQEVHENEPAPDRSTRWSGDQVRDHEPIRAWARRMDWPPPAELGSSSEESTMQEPQTWAQSAHVLAQPALMDTTETIEWFRQAEQGARQLIEFTGAMYQYHQSIQMDKGALKHLENVWAHTAAIQEQLKLAHQRVEALWGNVAVPQFERAS